MNQAEEVLRTMVEGWKLLGHRMVIDEFVLKHGRAFNGVLSACNLDTPKECYRNAAVRMISTDQHYVEGYTLNIEIGLPFLHAWIVDDSNQAYETTLKDVHNYRYYGIQFKDRFVTRQMVKWEVYGILGGLPQQTMELIDDLDEEEWKA
jgi:hypothetical protein